MSETGMMRCRKAVLAMASSAAVAMMLASGPANAQVNAGVEGGVAARNGSPSLDPGLAWGAHLAVKPLPMLSVGAYYLGYNMALDGAPATAHKVAFNTFGGKIWLTVPLPVSALRPYGYVGFGRVGVTYPVEGTTRVDLTSVVPTSLIPRDGHFLEVPVGLGLGYKTAKIVELSLDLAIRPSFGFAGDAYEGSLAYDKTKMGYTGMLGAAIDL